MQLNSNNQQAAMTIFIGILINFASDFLKMVPALD